jgi:hypothetical protein
MAGGQLDGIDGVAAVLRRGTTPVLSTDWGVDKTDGDGWILRNNGWLTERDIRVTPTGGAIVEYRGASKLKRHESGTVIVAMVETSKSRDIRVSSRRILFRHSRILSL